MTTPALSIVERSPHLIQAIRDGEVIAQAQRHSTGSLWSVVLMDQPAMAPHVKISRLLPTEVQRQLVRAVLEQAA